MRAFAIVWVLLAGCSALTPPRSDGGTEPDGGGGSGLPTWAQQAYLKASNTGAFDNFGSSVALSADGDTLAVGAPEESSNATGIDGNQADNSAISSGAVYVFRRTGATWAQEAYVKASNARADDRFGSAGALSLSADGATLAVGAPRESSSASASGAAYVFRRTGGAWAQEAQLKASNPGVDDHFGITLAISADGSTLAVAAEWESSNSTPRSGAAYVFQRGGTSWAQEAYLKASNPGVSDCVGTALALSADGDTLALGAYGEDSNATGVDGNQADNSAQDSGAVYVFKRSSAVWAQEAYLKASNANPGDFFGNSVALSADGSTLAVGAYGEASNAAGVDGDQANNRLFDSGAVYVFRRAGASWAQEAYLKASNPREGSLFGSALAFSADGDALAVGSDDPSGAAGVNGDQTDDSLAASGAAYLFWRTGASWAQEAYVKASNPGSWDSFSVSLALSADGRTLASGAYRESSNATGVDGNQADNSLSESGALYVFRR